MFGSCYFTQDGFGLGRHRSEKVGYPKDTRAIASIGEKHGIDMSLIKETIGANDLQKLRMVEKQKKRMKLKSSTVALLGIAFKSETNDIRESPAIDIAGKGIVLNMSVIYVSPISLCF